MNVDLTHITNDAVRPRLEVLLMRFTGRRRVNVAGMTSAQFQAVLDEGPGVVSVQGVMEHDQTLLANAIKVPDNVAVIPFDGSSKIRASLAGTDTIVDARNTSGGLWALPVDGANNMLITGRGIFKGPGCDVCLAHFEGFTGSSCRAIVGAGDGDHLVAGNTFDGNELSIDYIGCTTYYLLAATTYIYLTYI